MSLKTRTLDLIDGPFFRGVQKKYLHTDGGYGIKREDGVSMLNEITVQIYVFNNYKGYYEKTKKTYRQSWSNRCYSFSLMLHRAWCARKLDSTGFFRISNEQQDFFAHSFNFTHGVYVGNVFFIFKT